MDNYVAGFYMIEGNQKPLGRNHCTSDRKAAGATYTPKVLADFVSRQIIHNFRNGQSKKHVRILDPAVGDGELLICLLKQLGINKQLQIDVHGYDTDEYAISSAQEQLKTMFPEVSLKMKHEDFLQTAIDHFVVPDFMSLFNESESEKYDIIIANPPYVRTQVMGSDRSKELANLFGLSGRIDLYHAFILAIGVILHSDGIAGIIVSNRFMTTKTGASVRKIIRERFDPLHIWDLGDTKLFDVAVLPSVLLLKGKTGTDCHETLFTSIYETKEIAQYKTNDPITALDFDGIVQVEDGRNFQVKTGRLNTSKKPDDVWRIKTDSSDLWLSTVEAHSWGTFRDIGKIRVGVKTCADKIFIRKDWQSWPEEQRPELLRPLTTHHIANHYRAILNDKQRYILYPHVVIEGKRQVVNLDNFPNAKKYLEEHREKLSSRKYVLEAGRQWYEIWVPQDPSAWNATKLVFRDISDKPVFWIDKEKTIINGDCYWLICENGSTDDLIWLALGIGNSSFIESFYDHSFHNKLYAGRRRFMSQYVEKFPIPDPSSEYGKQIIRLSKKIFSVVGISEDSELKIQLDQLVWESFGLQSKEIAR
jgi:adenine-specific DNA-methyltransferase